MIVLLRGDEHEDHRQHSVTAANRFRAVRRCRQDRSMTAGLYPREATRPMRQAIVLGTGEEKCTVFTEGHRAEVPYARAFPTPRAERVVPGHLVAIATMADGSEVVIWRWFDAVVLDRAGDAVSLWEPAHGTVLAEPRNPERAYQPGSRAYLSAGLPGAQWWVAGPVIDRAEDADVDLGEVEQFFTGLGLWDRLD
jgi:hypothetical protein